MEPRPRALLASTEGKDVVVRYVERTEETSPHGILFEGFSQEALRTIGEGDHNLGLGDFFLHGPDAEHRVSYTVTDLVAHARVVTCTLNEISDALVDRRVDELHIGAAIEASDAAALELELVLDLLEEVEPILEEAAADDAIHEVHELLAHDDGTNVPTSKENNGFSHSDPLEHVSCGFDQDGRRGGHVTLVVP